MNTMLIVNSSPRKDSVSRRLTRMVAGQWQGGDPGRRVVERDLTAEPLPYLTDSWVRAAATPVTQRTPAQKHELALSDSLIDEVLAADVIVLGVPMHNFSIPAALKAWIDLIVRAGRTFSYGDTGPKGLIPAEKLVLAIVSRGGTYGESSPTVAADFQVPYLRHMLNFVGLKNLVVVDVDKQAFGADAARQSVDDAIEALSRIGADRTAQPQFSQV